MKLRRTIAILSATAVAAIALANDRGPEWRGVDEAVGKGLPQTAIQRLGPIVDAAMRQRRYPEAVRAIAQRIALESQIQGNKPEERITRMQGEIARAPREMRPVMEAILAHWYWQYFQENRWRFMSRSATAAPPGDDLTTWDLPRLYAAIDTHFVRALADPATLRSTPIADWDALLEKGTASDAWRPTLYDFLVHQALEFYASGEQGAAHPEDAFEPAAEGPILGSTEAFLAWKPETTDEASPKLRAIRLLQDLLRFHAADRDRSAFLDAELARLAFAKNAAFGEEKNARYKAALERLAEANSDHEQSARAFHAWALTLFEEDKLGAAWEIARRGAARFPDSFGARASRNLIRRIEAPALSISTERVWNAAAPEIVVRYRNVDRIHLRLVAVTIEEDMVDAREHIYARGPRELQALLGRKPEVEWSESLERTSDFRERRLEFPAPRVKKGVYRLLASPDPGFANGLPIQIATVWVSDLAIVMRPASSGVARGLVLDAIRGAPIANAAVRLWIWRNDRFVPDQEGVTDESGRFRMPAPESRQVIVVASHRGDRLAAAEGMWTYGSHRETPFERTMFFTDRAVYRPGQTIRYKGIALGVDAPKSRYETLTGRRLTVVFADGNGKEVDRREHRTNDYGSFSGSFTAPSGRLLGQMSIRVEGSPDGGTWFRVEEYKRPKFQVTIDTPRHARLGARVTVSGKATAYTGAPIDGAEVRWRVVRQVQYPAWRRAFWWRWEPPRPAQEIAHGRSRTGVDGAFEIPFVAHPDPAVDEADAPVFTFQVHATVTDPAGETRIALRAVPIGFAAMAAELEIDAWQVDDRPVAIEVKTTTLAGTAIAGSGTLTVHRLQTPARIERDELEARDGLYHRDFGRTMTEWPPASGPTTWRDADRVFERAVATDTSGHATIAVRLDPGVYRARFRGRDAFGKNVWSERLIQVIDPEATRLAIPVPDLLVAPKWSLEPGEELVVVWGSGYEKARAFVEIERRGVILAAYWTAPDRTQHVIRHPITEALRGGFTLRVTMVHDNRAYLHTMHVEVPWSDRQLSVRWEHFVSKLEPGQRETWTAVIRGPAAMRAAAEMVATLYDASLDQYTGHSWPREFGVFQQDPLASGYRFENRVVVLHPMGGQWPMSFEPEVITYRRFPAEIAIMGQHLLYSYATDAAAAPPVGNAVEEMQVRSSTRRESVAMTKTQGVTAGIAAEQVRGGRSGEQSLEVSGQSADGTVLDPSRISPRRNLQETAFFFPHLVADANGEVRMEFTMPEALTEWRFLGFAHDRDLRAGWIEDRAVTAKDLMVQPNPPRFLREDDVLEFTVKVTNRSAQRQSGRVRLALADAESGATLDDAFGLFAEEQEFAVPANESRTFAWRLQVPDGARVLVYKATAATERVSDGEEGWLPVLTRRILVAESLPLPMRGAGTKTFDFARLAGAGASPSLLHQSLTVQMVSNPSWYAVMALPYLIEYPYDCAEQVFNRLYANALAHHIAKSDPAIERVFERWRGTKALDSPLEKNAEIKSVVLEETPWLRQARNESQARRDVGVLFERARLESETARLVAKLRELQLEDGAWPWFPGGRPNDYITLYITAGLARLRHLGVPIDRELARSALPRIDSWAEHWYREIRRQGHPDDDHLSSLAALYLYTRSFYAGAKDAPAPNQEVLDYWLGQARRYWVPLESRQSQAHLALALQRFGDRTTARAILRSLKERSVHDDELGMYWRDLERSWWWYRAPIETQAMMIEAFDEVAKDSASVEACKVWLLKQKQTQDWKTTKATADAVYALLLRGTGPLASSQRVEVALGGHAIVPASVEAGTGFYEERFAGAEVRTEMSRVTVTKRDPGVAWGSVHWQYLEDMSRVTAYEGTPLQLVKTLYRRQAAKSGPVAEKVRGPVAVGDELVVRIELRADRDMEYVHMKDLRGSGLEPVNVLSGYRYQDGLAYYEQTRDTATHFFIDYLPKGTYVFEYPLRVQHVGRYQTGVAEIQCLYAPEFGSHSESIALEVR